ncbi:MAG: hypothetical protein K2M06_07500, partial [Muribaculaceae bacterium]|nr:hypothetical protein [Muribaculaceae bacterium]
SKPVMVQPTVPRFMRQGDKVVMTATVYNNSDETLAIRAGFDFRKAGNNSAVGGEVFEGLEVKAGESRTLSVEVEAPTDAAALSYKIWAEGAGFTDGEQGLVPVLEAASTVIESESFYLNPGSSEDYKFEVSNRAGFVYTLQYCQNPVWSLVKALRGCNEEMKTSTGIVSSLFSTLAALRIISDNPSVAKAIEEWKANPSEGALTSMLAKNEELKALVLNNTPWVTMAENETARMEALADFLDKDAAEKRATELLKKLRDLQDATGGFRWASWATEPSYWPTEVTLTTLGIARSMGLTQGHDKEIRGIAEKGLRWLDKSRYVRESKTETDLMFTYLHGLYLPAGIKPSTKEGEALTERTLAWVVKNRAKLDTVEKGYASLALRAFGKIQAAEALAASVKEFEVESTEMGTSFPSVSDIRGYATLIQALKENGATNEELDGMRQWVILQTQATDDLGARNPDYVIAAVMLTGTVWTDAKVSNNVSLNGEALTIEKEESSSGYFSLQLPAVNGKVLRLSIRPNGETPSYGSLTGIGKEPSAEIAAREGKDLRVVKRMMVMRGGSWTDATKTEIGLGERVRVDLEIKAGREMEYVTITDERPSGMEPVEQLSGWTSSGGLFFYRENRDASTRMFIDYLPKGTYHLSYEETAGSAGIMTSGICTVQSQLAPELTAHSGGTRLSVGARREPHGAE